MHVPGLNMKPCKDFIQVGSERRVVINLMCHRTVTIAVHILTNVSI